MATTSTSTTATAAAEAAEVRRPSQPLWQKIDRYLLPAFTILAIVYLLIPIAVMIVFSFNRPEGKFNYAWNEFSLDGWMNPFGWPGLSDAVLTSLLVALIATIVATILGTMIGLALTRYSAKWR